MQSVSMSEKSASTNAEIVVRTDPKTLRIPQQLITDIARALSNIRGWGSVEIFIQDYKVTQITERNIQKTNEKILIDE